MFKILFIEADEYRELHIPGMDPVPFDIVHPLGLMLLASLLRDARPERQFKILDMRFFKRDYSALPGIIKDFKPDIIGVRAVSRNAKFMHSLIEDMKAVSPRSYIIVGGPHITAAKEKVLEDKNIDIGVYGEGDITFPILVERLEDGKDYKDINGIIYREGDRIITTPPQDFIKDLDSLPFPAWDLVEMEPYFEAMYSPHAPIHYNARREAASILTSRGCPYNCSYCHNIFGKKVRFQSAEKAFGEIKRLYEEYGVRQFDIRDDIFNINKKRAHKICDLIIEHKLDLNLAFPNGLRGDIMDRELIIKLKEAGTSHITYALETASERLQKMLRKNINLEKLREAIRITSEQGILVRIFVMMGLPTETREEMLATCDYVMDPAVDFVNFHVFNPFEGTDIYNEIEDRGIDLARFEDNYDYYTPHFSTSHEMTDEEFVTLYNDIVRKFYSDAGRISRSYDKWQSFHRPPGT